MRSGITIDAGAVARRPFSVSSTTSDAIARSEPSTVNVRTSTTASMPSFRRGAGVSRIVRDGWRSDSPASVRSAAFSHAGGAQTMWVMTLVRWTPSSRSSISARSTSASLVSVSVFATTARPGG